MGRDDWFRNKKWDAATEAQFNEKLRRARNKAQYLRIQAGYLANISPKAALALLDRYFALGDHFDIAQAFLDQAEAHLTLGAQEEALRSLENALRREHEFPNLKTNAWSRYALLVAEKKLDHLYDNALQVLREVRARPLLLPVRSAPAIILSGPAQRSLTLWPARSRSRLATLSIESSDSFVASAAASIATGWNEPVPGRELHPLKSNAFHGALLQQLTTIAGTTIISIVDA